MTGETAHMVLLIALLNVLDVILTSHILEAGGVEAIPLSRWIIETYGYTHLAVAKMCVSTLLVWGLCEYEWRWFNGKAVVNGLVVALSLVCAWNAFGVVVS